MKILLAVDGSEFSDEAVRQCGELFGSVPDVELKIIKAVAIGLGDSDPWLNKESYFHEIHTAMRDHAAGIVAKAESEIRSRFPSFGNRLSTKLISGPAKEAIVQEAEAWGADLIVVGSHGYGFWPRAMLGSVSDSVLNHAHCSVLVVRLQKNSTQN